MPDRPSIIARIIRRPVTVLMLFLSLMGMGVIAYVKIPINLLPEGFSSSFLTVWTPYPDAPPEDVEDKVTEPIEEMLRTIPGIKSIRSTSSMSGSRVNVEFAAHVDMDMAYCEVKDRMERVKPQFPEEVKDYYCFRFNMNTDIPVIFLALLYDEETADPFGLTEEVIKPRLEGVDGVANVRIRGLIDDTIRILLDREKVKKYGVSLYRLVSRMARDNFARPAGLLKAAERRYTLRVDEKYRSLDEVREYPVTADLRIKDLGRVILDRAYRDFTARVDGKPAMVVSIAKESQRNTAKVCAAVERTLEDLRRDPRLEGFRFLVFFNQRELIASSLETLESSLAWGGLFAVLVLFLFLRHVRATFLVALAIPISILIGLVVIYFTGHTFNLLSLAGFTLAVGMLVDNAIVVMENITRRRALGDGPAEASARGASQVGTAILMATLTTIVVFLPLVFLQEDNNVRLMLSEVGLPISFSLLASLLTALVFLPFATTYLIRIRAEGAKAMAAVRAYHRKGAVAVFYERWLARTLDHRFGAFFTACLLFSTTAVANRIVQPALDQGGGEKRVSVEVELPSHFTLEEADRVFLRLESFAEAHRAAYRVKDYAAFFDRRSGSLELYLQDDVDPTFVKKLPLRLRKELPALPGVRYDLGLQGAGDAPKEFRVEITGPDSRTLEKIAFELRDRLKTIAEITNVRTDVEKGMDEVRLRVDRDLAQRFDVDPAVLRGIVAWGLGGSRLPDYDDQGREVRMQIEYAEERVENLDLLKSLNVLTNTGRTIPLGAVARMAVTRAPGSIVRSDGKTLMGISARPITDNIYTVSRKVREVMNTYPFPEGYGWTEKGGMAEYESQMGDIQDAFTLSVVLVFILMGTLFESTVLPLSVLFSIPFAFTGSIWLLAVTGLALDVNGAAGFILLAGIVVNNAIVLVDHVNQLRKEGLERRAAVLRGGVERLRPIFMTAMTTIFGLFPMAMPSLFAVDRSGGVFSYRTLAVVVLGGLSLSTLSTLFLVPLFYTLFDDLGAWIRNTFLAAFMPGQGGKRLRDSTKKGVGRST